jgi:hypothetical protein
MKAYVAFAVLALTLAAGCAAPTDGPEAAASDEALRSTPVRALVDGDKTTGELTPRGARAIEYDLQVYKDHNVSFEIDADFEPVAFLAVPGLFHDRQTRLDAYQTKTGSWVVSYESAYQDIDINNLPRDGKAYVIVTSAANLAANRSVTSGTFTVMGQDYEI